MAGEQHATSIASWSMALAKGLEAYGLDSAKLFADAGIDLAGIDSPYARLPVDCVQQVWRDGYENTDEYFGVTVSRFLSPASFHALGYALYSSTSLRQMLERLVRYRCVVSHMFFAELLDEGDYLRFTTTDERKLKTSVTHDVLYAFILNLARQLTGPEFSPARLMLDRTPGGSTAKLEEFIGAPIEFGAASAAMLLPKEVLEQPLHSGDARLAAKQDELVERYIGDLGLISEYMLRVKNEIKRQLAQKEEEVNIGSVADNLHVTVRTLQRRLKDENSSYHELLDMIRYELTMDWIVDPSLNATQIAFKLGFNDSGSFTRAFKGWTGRSFTEYRQSGSGSGSSSGSSSLKSLCKHR